MYSTSFKKFQIIFVLFFTTSTFVFGQKINDSFELPKHIEYLKKGTLKIHEQEICSTDIEPYLLKLDNKEALKLLSKYKAYGRKGIQPSGILIILSLSSFSAAIGQIGLHDGRGKIYTIAGAALSIPLIAYFTILDKRQSNFMKKIVKIYNQEMDARQNQPIKE